MLTNGRYGAKALSAFYQVFTIISTSKIGNMRLSGWSHLSNWVMQPVQGLGQTWKPLRLAESTQSSRCWSGAKSQLLSSSQLNTTPPQGAGLPLQGLGWVTNRITGLLSRAPSARPDPSSHGTEGAHCYSPGPGPYVQIYVSHHENKCRHSPGTFWLGAKQIYPGSFVSCRKPPPTQASSYRLPSSLVVISLSQK